MKKFLTSILAVLVVSMSLPHVAWAAGGTSGNCGPILSDGSFSPSVKWVLDSDGVLTISGKGAIADFYFNTGDLSTNAPWYGYGIKTIIIEDSVTKISQCAFSGCKDLTSVTIPDKVTFIGNYAFQGCTSLQTFFYPTDLSLENALVPGSANRIKYKVTSTDSTTGVKTVKLLDMSNKDGQVEFSCDAMGEGYLMTSVDESIAYKTTINHEYPDAGTDAGENHSKTCHRCGYILTESHTYGEYETKTSATCTADEEKHAYCTVCNHEDTYFVPNTRLDHSLKEDYENNRLYCKNCDYEYSITAPPTSGDNNGNDSQCEHNYVETVVAPTETTLGGTLHKCSLCGDEYWTDFTKDDTYAQTYMPNGESVYHYSTNNGLATETTVDVGDGQTLRVFLQDPLDVLKKNDTDVLGINVEYIEEGSARYNELMSQIDGDHPVEHIKFFNVYPTVNGVPVTGALDGSIYMEYEIPEGWDESDLEMILVQDGDDQEFDETVLEIDGKRYLAMWKNHFSPYAMIDKLSEEEQAALNIDKLNDDQKEQLNAASGESSSSSSAVKTGDETGYIVLMSASMALIAGLYLELCMKKKRN